MAKVLAKPTICNYSYKLLLIKILVTGNEGMIGSVVEKVLSADGCEVIGFDINKSGVEVLHRVQHNQIGILMQCASILLSIKFHTRL
ncbi:NAD-dependent epimerase/dehydratase family protein [aff. Roholtiella sp. LEGE 12411]|uniref:NAD-dependent epimerase/dehydratase family protein n=1 Tax=aff. Roholtiella sp. LEGE 12411 TaxID=1828822 RepID=UPI001881DB24|nr:NAD-dependent epimerase/dehydratase family protein [aff. Roholtiella sp. LEGE 12411]MBE9034893.1 NAD-dependent epimerase/dehydratase family protein [aff. Roholtiella sp. LEGE 12411]